MADRSARRRAAVFRDHARQLGEKAARKRDASLRKHILDLAETHLRAADQMDAAPPAPQFPTQWR
jgi:hypothetical protein